VSPLTYRTDDATHLRLTATVWKNTVKKCFT